MANIKKRLEDTSAAIHHYQMAIHLDHSSTSAHTNLALLLSQDGKLTDALANANKAITINPNNSEAYFALSVVALKQNQLAQAIEYLQKTIALDPHHIQAHYTLAQQLQYSDGYNNKEALQHYQKVLAIQPEFPDALVNYGAALLADRQDDAALKNFYQAIEIDPEHYEAHYNLGCALLEKQQLAPALEHFIKPIAKKPTPEAYYNIGIIYSYQDRHGDALSYLKKAVELNPNYFAAYNNLGTVYLKIEDRAKAIEHFEKALIIQPNNTEVAFILTALRQENTPARAPQLYVEHLFDQYAPSFDKHLVEHLKYETPLLLYEAVMAQIKDNLHTRKIIDLGCGTGLAGKLFRDLAQPLIGVDLSQQMIALLKEKNLYDQLLTGDIHNVLKEQHHCALIIAADVLTYIGDLQELFEITYSALQPGGLFAFSTELAAEGILNYSLQPSIRYAHTPIYIQTIAEQSQFEILSQLHVTLRLQHNQPLPGLITVLRKRT